ncbi:hypothetical protein ABE218_09010 [Bacillus smithii]|uniref:hypothetical protein n=1 Tax=Bacillus smithii TaxID=1479 RepID=UPI003D20A680
MNRRVCMPKQPKQEKSGCVIVFSIRLREVSHFHVETNQYRRNENGVSDPMYEHERF